VTTSRVTTSRVTTSLVTTSRVAVRLATATALLLATTAGFGGVARATSSSTGGSGSNNFNLAAEGDAMQSTLTDPSAPLIQTYSISPYGASATISSLGQTFADAGAPYAPVIYGLPGTVNGLGSGGQLPSVPPLPGYTSASYPGKPASTEVLAGYDLTATTGQTDATGKVALGAQAPGAGSPTMFASAETTANSDGSVTATATAGADVVNFGPLLDIGNVSSTETLTVPSSGKPTFQSTEDVGTVTLLGLKTGLTLPGLSFLNVNVPLPLNSSLLSVVNGLLAPSGVSLAFLPQTFTYSDGTHSTGGAPAPSKTLQGVESGALQVSINEMVPSQGAVSFIYTLGRTYVSVTNAPGFGIGGPPPVSLPLSPTSVSPAPATTSNPAPPASTAGAVPSGTGGGNVTPSGAGVTQPMSSSTGSGQSPPAVAAPPPAQPSNPVGGAPAQGGGSHSIAAIGPSIESLYLLLVLGAIVIFLAAQLLRLLGVRLPLSSGR
jgi:hypothetical protein